MKKKVIAVMLAMALALGSFSTAGVSEGATKKATLSTKRMSMKVGQSKKIKLKNNKQKVTWKTSSKAVTLKAKKKTGVTVVAKKKGTAKVTAKIGAKKLTCTVTVTGVSADKPSDDNGSNSKPTGDSGNNNVTSTPNNTTVPTTHTPNNTTAPTTHTPNSTTEPTSAPDTTEEPTPTPTPMEITSMAMYGELAYKYSINDSIFNREYCSLLKPARVGNSNSKDGYHVGEHGLIFNESRLDEESGLHVTVGGTFPEAIKTKGYIIIVPRAILADDKKLGTGQDGSAIWEAIKNEAEAQGSTRHMWGRYKNGGMLAAGENVEERLEALIEKSKAEISSCNGIIEEEKISYGSAVYTYTVDNFTPAITGVLGVSKEDILNNGGMISSYDSYTSYVRLGSTGNKELDNSGSYWGTDKEYSEYNGVIDGYDVYIVSSESVPQNIIV